jgi:hypothetical protein
MTTVTTQWGYIAHVTAILAYVIKKRKRVAASLVPTLPCRPPVVGAGKGVVGKLRGHTVSAHRRTPQEEPSGLSFKEKDQRHVFGNTGLYVSWKINFNPYH